MNQGQARLQSYAVEPAMNVMMDVVRSIRKIKAAMRASNKDRIRVDVFFCIYSLAYLEIAKADYAHMIQHLSKVSLVECPIREDLRSEREETIFIGESSVEGKFTLTAWTDDIGLDAMLSRFPAKVLA